ncbi:MAG TPA: PAS domain S-box protein [Methylocella sp.]|nr:PAS domain S-box protein [Methylocella sp.]
MTPLRVLIIGDNPADRTTVRSALTDGGFTVSEAYSGVEGIECARQTNPGCIVLDYRLPDMEGLAVLEQLIPDPAAPEAAVIVLTETADDEIATLVTTKGAQDYLTKSQLELYDLRRVIRNAVDRLKLIAQRKRAEQALAASEARYRSIIEDQPEMVSRFLADGTVTFANAAYVRAFGRAPAELEGSSLYDFMPEIERAFVRNTIASLTPRNPVVTHRHRVFSADGSIRWHEWTNRLLPGTNGKMAEYQSTGRDVTERKRAEDALRASQERTAAILKAAMDAIITVDEEQRIILFNPAAARLLLCRPEEAIGQPLERFVPELFEHAHARVMSNLGEVSALRADGRKIPIEASISSAVVEGRKLFTVILRDITERKRAEEARRESEARFRGTFENAAVGMAHVALDGKWLAVNERLCAITGYTREELLARTFQDITHAEDLGPDLDNMRKLLAGEIPNYAMDKRYIRKDGQIVWIALTVGVQRDPSGAPQYLISVIRNINSRRLAEEALRASEERLGLFIEHAPAAIAMFDRNMHYLAASRRWREDYQLAENLRGRSHYDVLPEIPDAWKAAHQRCLAGAVESSEGERFERSDGSVQWIKWDARPWRDSAGAIGGILIAAEDITERNRAEEALRVSKERLAQAVAIAEIGIADSSHASSLINLSPLLREMFGFDKDEPVTPEKVLGRILPEDRISFAERFTRERDPAGDGAATGEFRILHPSRGTRLLSMRAQAYFEGEGAARHWIRSIGAVRDVTQRKQAEQALSDATSRLRLALQAGHMGIWEWNLVTDDIILDAAEYEVLGYEEGSPGAPKSGSQFFELVHPDDREGLIRNIETLKQSRETYEAEFRIIRPDGAVRWLVGRGEMTYRPDGRAVRLRGINFDITERKEAEEHQRFLMGELSHRSKNLLSIVQAMASQTMRSAESLATFQERFAQRLQGLAASHDVLFEQNWIGAPLVTLIRQHLAPFIEAEASRLRLNGPAVSVSPEAAQALGLAFHELATNSVKYGALSRPSGQVTVTWVFEGGAPEERRLRINWQEQGGPLVAPPSRKGFGHAVIDRMVAHSLDGGVMLDFAPEGFSWSVSFPTTHLVKGGAEPGRAHDL